MRQILSVLALLTSLATLSAAEPPMRLWSGDAPGEKGGIGEEKDQDPGKAIVAGKPIIRLGNVSQPTLTLFPAPKDKATGAAVVVCPGGGYSILALDLEGSEVCEWFNSIGVTAVLVKYRVPVRKDRPGYEAPVQDAQRAISLTRQHAAEWGIDPKRIGLLGFSAGGHLTAVASNSDRMYPAADDADKVDCRPDFTALIYPAYLVQDKNLNALVPELTISKKSPPAFIAMSQDDPVKVEGAFAYALALKNAKVPFELHVYPDGGHGYGLRKTDKLVTTWPDRLADWMKATGLLKPAK